MPNLKSKISNLKYILPASCFLLLASSSVFAQTATPSSESVNRIQEAINKNLKNSQTILGQEDTRLIGYTGVVADIRDGSLTLETNGESLQVSLTGTVVYVKDGKNIKPEQISLKDKALVIGNFSASKVISAKRIVITKEETKKIEKKIVLSPIKKIDPKKKTITLTVDGLDAETSLGKLVKLDLTTTTPGQKVFGVIMINLATKTTTLIQAKLTP